MQLSDSISTVKGIGEKTEKLFHKLGVYTIEDLIRTYPRTYIEYTEPVSVNSIRPGVRCAIRAKVVTNIEVKKPRRMTIVSFSVSDGTGSVRIVFFNSPYIRSVIRKGDSYVFVGTPKVKGNFIVMEMPEYYELRKYTSLKSVMQPVYPLTAGLTSNTIRKAVKEVSYLIEGMDDILPKDILNEYGLMPRGQASFNVHFPRDMEELKKSIKRLAFDEFLSFLYDIKILRENCIRKENAHPVGKDAAGKLQEFIGSLPFELTKGQKDAVSDIITDMTGPYTMNRLIQGDVGSGKTVVAEAALYVNYLAGYQGALMVPTEVLAVQHFKDLSKVFSGTGMRISLLTGSLKDKEKKDIKKKLLDGEIDIVVGTHALIQDSTDWKNLGLTVIDEQHRFGVNQRKKLSMKGNAPHTIVMSATPIPRTLAMIIYADLDVSLISEMPMGRKRIMNCVVGTSYRPTAYKFIGDEIKKGHQTYIICPMIEENESSDIENVIDYSYGIKDWFGSEVRIEYLHGKLSEEDKIKILERFMDGSIDILVSTTVIEVGINNPNATVMMIENAERFGLAQLHQLRGRVGRGDAQSYAIFIDTKESEESKERLSVLENSNDGFFIAKEDLRLRGPGDFFGIRQSGDMPFNIADIYNHADMLKMAQDIILKYSDRISFKDTKLAETTI